MTSLLSDGEQAPQQTKVCTGCGTEKPLHEFNKCRRSADGRQTRCRACFSKYNAARYSGNRERFKVAVKEYKESNPEAVFRTRLQVWEKNNSRLNTYRLVEAALAAGVIQKPDACCICGLPGKDAGARGLHKHHFDYNDPLGVVWLCPKCHGQVHKLMRDRRAEVAA